MRARYHGGASIQRRPKEEMIVATDPLHRPVQPTPLTAHRIDILFPSVGDQPVDSQPLACPRCGCRGFHWHQQTSKRVNDQRRQTVASMRYLCKSCGRSVRLYPPGVSTRRQSEAVRGLSVVLYRLGLSYRNIQKILAAWECPLGPATIWQNVHGLEAAARGPRRRGRVTIETVGSPSRLTYPADGPNVHLRLVTDRAGTMRLEIRTREDWRDVWRRLDTPRLAEIGVRLIGAKPLVLRPRPEALRPAQ